MYIYIRIEYASYQYSMFKQMYDIYKIYIRYQTYIDYDTKYIKIY